MHPNDTPHTSEDKQVEHRSLIDAVAAAICAAEFPEVGGAYAWAVQDEAGRQVYRRQAQAAILTVDAWSHNESEGEVQ